MGREGGIQGCVEPTASLLHWPWSQWVRRLSRNFQDAPGSSKQAATAGCSCVPCSHGSIIRDRSVETTAAANWPWHSCDTCAPLICPRNANLPSLWREQLRSRRRARRVLEDQLLLQCPVRAWSPVSGQAGKFSFISSTNRPIREALPSAAAPELSISLLLRAVSSLCHAKNGREQRSISCCTTGDGGGRAFQ